MYNIDYKDKYLKYKQKYLDLKGGSTLQGPLGTVSITEIKELRTKYQSKTLKAVRSDTKKEEEITINVGDIVLHKDGKIRGMIEVIYFHTPGIPLTSDDKGPQRYTSPHGFIWLLIKMDDKYYTDLITNFIPVN